MQITLEAMKTDEDNIALQGIEFWSTVCDEEVDLSIELSEVGIQVSLVKVKQRNLGENKYLLLAFPCICLYFLLLNIYQHYTSLLENNLIDCMACHCWTSKYW